MTIITKELLKQIKDAKTILIYRDRKGVGQMSLLFEDEIRGVKVESRLEYLVDTTLKIYKGYYEGEKEINHKAYCCAYLSYLNHRSQSRTAFQSLKVGDEIKFEFVGRNNNQYTSKVGLYVDEVNLIVKRATKPYNHDEYLLTYSICEDNSARMVNESNHTSLTDIDPTSYNFQNRLATAE